MSKKDFVTRGLAKKAKTTFTDAEQELIRRAASRVWDECAYDCLVATAEESGKDVNKVSIPRSQVIEIALDAGRAEELLRRDMKKTQGHPDALTEEFLDRFTKADYKELIKIVTPAFHYARYGV